MLTAKGASQHLKKVTKNFFVTFLTYLYYGIKMIKKLFILSAFLTVWSCSKKEDKVESVPEKRIEITPFKINKVMLRDTQLIKTIFVQADSGTMSIPEYEESWGREFKFLDHISFNEVRKAVWA